MNKQNYNLAPETSAFSPCGLIDIPLVDGAILLNKYEKCTKRLNREKNRKMDGYKKSIS